MVYTAIFQNKARQFTYVQKPGPPDRRDAWEEFQKSHAPTEHDCLLFMVLGTHEILDYDRTHPLRELSQKDVDVFDLNMSPDSSDG